MTLPEFADDGAVLAQILVSPRRGLARAAERRRALAAILVATLAALAFAAVAAPRVDVTAAVARQLDSGPQAAEMTPHQRDEAIATAQKISTVGQWVAAVVMPSLQAVVAAVFLWLGFRVVGAPAGFRPTLAVSAHALLPVWLGRLLAIPALVRHAPVPVGDLPRLVPSSLAAFLPASAPPPLAAAAGALDLFSLWALALAIAGMARVSGATRVRAAAVTIVLWVSYVCLFQIVPAAAVRGGP